MRPLSTALLVLLLTACIGPRYTDTGGPSTTAAGSGEVLYHLHDAYKAAPPACVAILPFQTPPGGLSTADVSIDQTETVRRAIYAHISPQGKRDVEIARIDHVLADLTMPDDGTKASAVYGKALNCDALLMGEVSEYGSVFIGVFSRVAVGADLKLVRASDGAVLWEGRHNAESLGGSVPLSPIGLAMGILDAASNVSEETLLRVIDDLARRLVSTIPDDRIAVLEDPAPQPLPGPALKKVEAVDVVSAQLLAQVEATPQDMDLQIRLGEHLMKLGDYDGALARAEAALSIKSDTAPLEFLRGRALIKLGRLERADDAIVRAIALDADNAQYLNGLGYLNSAAGNHVRALAAYRMAVDKDSANGFAYYNMGVTLYNLGDEVNAADAFYGAGLAYLKQGNYGQVEKALADLKELNAAGVPVADEIATLTGALLDLSKQEASP